MPDNQAAIKIQSRVRGFFARKKYAYQPLPIEQQSDYNIPFFLKTLGFYYVNALF